MLRYEINLFNDKVVAGQYPVRCIGVRQKLHLDEHFDFLFHNSTKMFNREDP